MNTTHFRQLIAAVEARPVEHFDMGAWKCGTQCCAFGSGVEAHPEWGYGLSNLYCGEKIDVVEMATGCSVDGFAAAAKVLDISRNEAVDLFHPSEYITNDKPEVLDRLRKYLAEHEMEVTG